MLGELGREQTGNNEKRKKTDMKKTEERGRERMKGRGREDKEGEMMIYELKEKIKREVTRGKRNG